MRRTKLSRRTPLRRISKKRSKTLATRAAVREFVFYRDSGMCQGARVRPDIQCGGPMDVHEIVPRSAMPGSELRADLAICCCRRHHEWAHTHPQEARKVGLLRSAWDFNDPTKRPTSGPGSGTNVDVHGYRRLYRPGHPLATSQGWVPEHRYVMWEAGLLTDPTMHVHHVNHNKLDNRLENLEVLTPSEHQREHHPRQFDRLEARRLYLDEGLSTIDVALRMGTQPGNVSRMLAETNTPIRPPRLRRPDVDRVEVERRLKAGEPALRIARDMRVSHGTVIAVRDRAGIPPLPVGRPAESHCGHGHPFDEANTRWWRGKRACRACARENARRRRGRAA